jgi:hypothetical protein
MMMVEGLSTNFSFYDASSWINWLRMTLFLKWFMLIFMEESLRWAEKSTRKSPFSNFHYLPISTWRSSFTK